MRALMAAFGLALAAPIPIGAQSAWTDPTRPSAAAQPAKVASAVAPGASVALPSPPASAPDRLLSVHLPRGGSPSALVNDRLVRVGDRLGTATVAGITADGLQLRTPRGALAWLPLIDAPGLARVSVPAPPLAATSTGPVAQGHAR